MVLQLVFMAVGGTKLLQYITAKTSFNKNNIDITANTTINVFKELKLHDTIEFCL